MTVATRPGTIRSTREPVPKLKGALFESAVIERYRGREESVEEALIDMYLAGVSTRQVEHIGSLLWGERMPSQTLSDKLKKVYEDIDRWRNRPLTDRSYPICSWTGCGTNARLGRVGRERERGGSRRRGRHRGIVR